MKVLVTGSKGFIGKNLVLELRNRNYKDIFECGRDTELEEFDKFCKEVDFIFHLAGVNRPNDQSEFMECNYSFTLQLLNTLKKHNNFCPIMMSSSIQAEVDNPYGNSKKAGEDLIFSYNKETGARVFVYRFPNIFGKWSKPNYNSAIATFCNNISRGIPITVSDPNVTLKLVYIDDVIEEILNAMEGNESKANDFCEVSTVYTVTISEIVELLYSFKRSREEKSIPDMSNAFIKKLYSTYLSYLPTDQLSYFLKMNTDSRGTFTEFIKTKDRGQISINNIKPGIFKGNHWHHTKNEKFLVVSGKGIICLKRVDDDKIIEYFSSGEKMEVIDIPAGYVHKIENIGDEDMTIIIWTNEPFDPEKPDTYYMEVKR